MHPAAAARARQHLAREKQLRDAIQDATHDSRNVTSLTAVQATDTYTGTVHLGWDYGSYDSYPICGALKNRDCSTTDETANCPRCARVLREIGMEHLIKDVDGWTGIYRNR